jgi:iron complex transport system substrate-binding protein
VLRRSLVLLTALAVAFAVAQLAAARGSADQADPTRIVSLSPTATESLFAIGAGKQVVAVDDQSDYPKQAPQTKLSGFKPNAEAIASYNPDLVVVSGDGGIVASLQKLGIDVLLQPAAKNVAEAYDEIRQLGRATGHDEAATTLVRSMQKKLTALIRSVPKKSRHLKVYHELTPDYYSATSSTFIGRIYRLFGFSNIADAADKSGSGYPQLSAEFVVASNPDIVVLADSICCSQSAATVAARPGWRNIAAVQKKRVVAIDDSVASRWGPRIVDLARAVAAVARRS